MKRDSLPRKAQVGRKKLTAPLWAQDFHRRMEDPFWVNALNTTENDRISLYVEQTAHSTPQRVPRLPEAGASATKDEASSTAHNPPHPVLPPQRLFKNYRGEAGNAVEGEQVSGVCRDDRDNSPERIDITVIDDAWAVRMLAEIRRRSRSIDSCSVALNLGNTDFGYPARHSGIDASNTYSVSGDGRDIYCSSRREFSKCKRTTTSMD